MSKSLGEPDNCTVIRTSIIGEEFKNFLSLIEWVKSNKDKTVNGYRNHIWNGITCLQFAKLCEHIINKNLFWNGVRHVFSPTSATKAQLVKLISDIYNLNVHVIAVETAIKCDRTLSTIYPIILEIPELYEQIKEQKEFKDNGKLYSATSRIR
jgi:dTDP-4-dehydrorhamnose reductase